MYLLTQQKNGISALELKRHLGVSNPSAWSLKHTLLQVMIERDAGRKLTGIIQLDDLHWGGERRSEKPGRGSPHTVPFLAAVAANRAGHPIAMRGSYQKASGEHPPPVGAPRSRAVVLDGRFFPVAGMGCTSERICCGRLQGQKADAQR
jgi:hypothetical protein